jgi:hypothetical protein
MKDEGRRHKKEDKIKNIEESRQKKEERRMKNEGCKQKT